MANDNGTAHTVTDFLDDNEDQFYASEPSEIVHRALSQWRSYFSLQEWDFLRYLEDNTFGWSESYIDVTLDQLLVGLPNDQPDSVWSWRVTPVGYSRTDLIRLIRQLRDKGAILVEGSRRARMRLSLNLDWSPAPDVPTLRGQGPTTPSR